MALPTPRGYRSATEYYFREEETDAIVRIAAYHRRDFDLSVIWLSPCEHANVRQSIATPFQWAPSAGLGLLDRLPLELLHDTLLRLDMHSLFKLRQVNLKSRNMVDCLKQYQNIVSHGLNLLCALLRTRLAAGISLFDFYKALCTKPCSICGEFGGFMSLLSWTRCCFKCLREAPEIQVTTLASVRKQFHLTKAELGQLKSFKTLPGIYAMEEYSFKSRITIVSAHEASLVCKQDRDQHPQLVNAERKTKLNFMGSCALPYYDKYTGKIEHGVSCAGCQLVLEKDIIGTRGEIWAFEARDKVYARDSFLNHFRWCEQAQLLWTMSVKGKHRPTELPVAAGRGGFFNRRE